MFLQFANKIQKEELTWLKKDYDKLCKGPAMLDQD